MFIDARGVPNDHIVTTDVCIIGAGAAGITLAREFAGAPFKVCLLESGGLEPDRETQLLYEGDNIGHPYHRLISTRLRYFGGSTNHWTGACRPLDEIDFEARDWVPHSGWPFGRDHLEPYYARAQRICQLGKFAYRSEDWESRDKPPLPVESARVLSTVFQFSPPTRFGAVYRAALEHAEGIRAYLYANVVEIETMSSAKVVTRVRVACLEGNRFWVTAKYFILATGGIENARMLLLSNKVQRAGLGNHGDRVGRFFMEHPHLYSGLFLPKNRNIVSGFYRTQAIGNARVRGAMRLSENTLRKERLLNFGAFLNEYWIPGAESLRYIADSLCRGQIPRSFLWNLKRVFADVDEIAVDAYRKAVGSEDPTYGTFILHNRSEQAPNPDSRVTLGPDRDALGNNRVRLDWRLSPIDKRSLRRAHEIIGQELGRAGLGRFRVELDKVDGSWPSTLAGGNHHMGTTRMHVDPKRGVVDENCRVHGISNLFIAGSSVFPTIGFANPTLTIVALGVRLADHVKRVIA